MPVLMPCTIRPASSTGKPVATVHTKAPTRKQVSANSTSVLALIHLSMKPTHGKYVVIENRREAIRYALKMGRVGDVIILAGKGHETYQEIMGVKRPFDEKVVVQELLQELRSEKDTKE